VLEEQIVEYQQTIEALRRREQEFKALLENAPDAIARFDRQLRYLYANQAVEQALGLSREILIGKTNLELLMPNEICLLWEKHLNQVFEIGQNIEIEFEFQTPLGLRAYQARLVPELDLEGAIASVLVVSRDVTEAKQAEQALQNVTTQLANVFEILPDALICVDTEWRYTFVNSRAEALLDKPRSELLGKNSWEVFPSLVETQAYTLCHQAMAQQKAIEYEEFYPEFNKWFFIRLNPSTTGLSTYFQDISDYKQTEKALQQREEQFRQLADAVPQIVWVVNANNELEYVNQQWCDYAGLTLEQARKRESFSLVIHPEDIQSTYQQWAKSLATGTPYEKECRLKRASDGVYRWFLVRTMPVKDEQGRVIQWYGTSTDIDDLKRTEETLQESEERLRLALDSGRMGIWDWSILSGDLKWSENLEEIHGMAPGSFGGTFADFQKIIHPEDREMVNEAIAQAVKRQSNYEIEFRTFWPDGSTHWIAGKGKTFSNAEGKAVRMIGVAMDVTERKRNEEAQAYLAEASKVLSSSLDYQTTLASVAQLTVPELADWCTVHVIEEDGSIQQLAAAHVDPAKVKWAEELKNKYPLDLNAARGAAFTLRTGQSDLLPDISDELVVQAARDPEHLQLLRDIGFKSVMTVPLMVQDRILGVISFVSTAESQRRYDKVDLLLAEELGHRAALAVDNARLYRAQERDRALAEAANRIKDEFLAVLSHELRTPLNPILGWAQLLKSRKYDEKTTIRALEIIERNAQLQTQLIDDLLDVSRILQGKLQLEFQPINLNVVIAAAIETVRLAAQAKSIQIKTHLYPDIGKITGNSARLQQVVWNLLSNAIKFTPKGGKVEITLQSIGDYAQIKVSDTGIGIKPEFIPYVFDYFRQADSQTTRKFGGLGLGLAIVRHLVELHGGTVWADSQGEGQGAVFTIELPLIATTLEANHDGGQENQSANLNGIRVLVVDDEPDMREFVAFVLEESGAQVTATTSAAEALKALEQSTFDLLLSDIGMPEMDGYMLMQQVRGLAAERGGEIAAIALTAYAGDLNQQKALSAGFQAHISKPVEPEELVREILNLIVKEA
jgi:hypothetical protein